VNTAVTISAGAGGEDAQDFARMLRVMYDAWDGPLHREPGVHRLVRVSPFDAQHRRHTAFAAVDVDGEAQVREQVRSYVLHPYTLAKAMRGPDVSTEDVYGVLAGDLSVFYDDEGQVAARLEPAPRITPPGEVDPDELAAAQAHGRNLAEKYGW
jgi:protein subunit release factor B